MTWQQSGREGISFGAPGRKIVRVACVDWPDGLRVEDPLWQQLKANLDPDAIDVLVTNELPFGDWIAAGERFDAAAAQRSIDDHERGMAALSSLGISWIISSRPVWCGERLSNEAVLIHGGDLLPVRRKRYLPNETGWYEKTWFVASEDEFRLVDVNGLQVGILLSTEAMFTERARDFGDAGADLIAIPRSSGTSAIWRTAAAMAAISSGSYVVSSNRSGGSMFGTVFGGGALAYSPGGSLIGGTQDVGAVLTIPVDIERADRQKRRYPCYLGVKPESSRVLPSARERCRLSVG